MQVVKRAISKSAEDFLCRRISAQTGSPGALSSSRPHSEIFSSVNLSKEPSGVYI
jgi:hypothetical protein